MRSWRDGWRRVAAAPAIVAGVLAMTFLLAWPLALTLREDLAAHLDRSVMADEAADAVNYDWWQEFSATASGLASTFTAGIIGFAGALQSLDAFVNAQRQVAPVAAALAFYLGGWTLLTGGIVDRYARQRPTRAFGFFGAIGAHAFGLLRLALAAGLVYWWLFAYVREWLLDDQLTKLTRDISVERTVFLWRLALTLLFGALLVVVNVVFDYAKIRLVVEDRRSALGALAGAIRFVRRHAAAVAAVYAMNTACFALLLAAWALVAPGAGGSGASLWWSFAASQLYVLGRLVLKLQFIASQTALFQSRLAHATYIGAPEPAWPDSPAAETIRVGQGHNP